MSKLALYREVCTFLGNHFNDVKSFIFADLILLTELNRLTDRWLDAPFMSYIHVASISPVVTSVKDQCEPWCDNKGQVLVVEVSYKYSSNVGDSRCGTIADKSEHVLCPNCCMLSLRYY